MATRKTIRRSGLLLSLALTIALPTGWSAAMAAETSAPAAATPATPSATPATPASATPATPAATPATPAATPATPAATPAPPAATPAPPAATPAPPAAEPVPASTQPQAEATSAASSEVESKATEKKSRKAKKEREVIHKGANFEQLERHKGDGYYGAMHADMHKGDDFEQLKRHQDDGYYTSVPATPKEYPKPVFVEPPTQPAQQPAVVTPLPTYPTSSAVPRNDDPNRNKFDDDPGSTGSITFTRHIKTANEMLSGGHTDLAKKHFKEALRIFSDKADVYPGYIESCQKSNDWSETTHAIEKLIQLDPKKEKDYQWQYGEAWFNLVKYDKAIPVLKKALGYGHHQDQIHRMLLKMAQQQKNNADVLVEYNALCKLKPSDYQTHLDFAALLELTGKHQEAMGHYRSAVNANPADGATMGRLAYLLMYHNKDYDGAIGMYTKAMAADPRNAKVYQDGVAYCAQQKEIAAGPKKKSN